MNQVLSYGPRFIFDDKTMVRIDRTTPWGNPFIVGVNGDRNTVCNLHKRWLNEWVINQREIKYKIGIREYSNKWVIEHLEELINKKVVCWCAPERCHGEFLILLANKEG